MYEDRIITFFGRWGESNNLVYSSFSPFIFCYLFLPLSFFSQSLYPSVTFFSFIQLVSIFLLFTWFSRQKCVLFITRAVSIQFCSWICFAKTKKKKQLRVILHRISSDFNSASHIKFSPNLSHLPNNIEKTFWYSWANILSILFFFLLLENLSFHLRCLR